MWTFSALQGARPPISYVLLVVANPVCRMITVRNAMTGRMSAAIILRSSLEHKRKKERKTKPSPSSFTSFSRSMPVPLGQLPSFAGSGVVATCSRSHSPSLSWRVEEDSQEEQSSLDFVSVVETLQSLNELPEAPSNRDENSMRFLAEP